MDLDWVIIFCLLSANAGFLLGYWRGLNAGAKTVLKRLGWYLES